MPLPIWPAPTMPILRRGCAILSARTPSGSSPRAWPRSLGRSLTSTISIHLLRLLRPSKHVSQFFAPVWLVLDLVELRRKLRQGLVEIGHQSIIGDLKDGRFLILVDGDDDFRILHAGEMLDGAGNSDGNIEA